LRPGRPDDAPFFVELARRSVAAGETDVVPTQGWLDRLLAGYDWETHARVVEREGRSEAGVLVFERPVIGGTVTRIEAGGDRALRADLVEWGVRYSRACGALAAQVWRGRGRGADLENLGLEVARPFLRMDRPDLANLPETRLPDGYRLHDEDSGAADHLWAEAYNLAFAEHWRHSPKPDSMVASRRSRPGSGPELLALDSSGEPAALVTCAVETYEDARRQPVGLVGVVGTSPGHRRRGLASAMLGEALRRLRAAGARSASLYVDGMNPTRAFDAYARVGFEVAFEFEVWEADFS
jgi:ribosomal protein S18 acetylase RimI-like enzyme